MADIELGAQQAQFAEIVWENEPVGSGELVKICEKKLNWKKPTTYTVLRKLCEKGILQNIDGIVKYSVLNESKQIFASKYLPYLPTEEELKRELESGSRIIEIED